MDKQTFEKLLQLNTDFYNKTASSFSRTRLYPWPGWKKTIEIIKRNIKGKREINILDLGSGNGRFYSYLQKNISEPFHYLGLDTNQFLLEQAGKKYGNSLFQKKDIFRGLNYFSGKFDVVTVFGVTHHIPKAGFRKKWFSFLSNLLFPEGLLIFTIWRFAQEKRFYKKTKSIKTGIYNFKSADLQKGDYFLSWGKNKQAFRFCHAYSDEELHEIQKSLEKKELTLLQSFLSDGKSSKLNRYFIYKKNLRANV